MVLTPDEYSIRLIDLPHSVKALVVFDEDGFPNIYVNARLSRASQLEAIRHEIRHIDRNDAYSAEDIRKVEKDI